MDFTSGIALIRKALLNPLPGEDAQHLMAPKLRKTTTAMLQDNPNHRMSSVMILFYPDEQNFLNTVFIERPINDSVHSGQIAFPGGKMDESDENVSFTALRETEEEIGVPVQSVEILGTLSQLFIPASNFLVIPHIGFTSEKPSFIPNPEEVRSLIPVSLTDLMDMKSSTREFATSYGTLQAPCFQLETHSIWGATAMMISELRELLSREINK